MSSLPIPSFNDIKKLADYWRKFKGKMVRIWFIRKVGSASNQVSCKSEGFVADEVKRRNPDLENAVDISYNSDLVLENVDPKMIADKI
jgi:hypothetical protein